MLSSKRGTLIENEIYLPTKAKFPVAILEKISGRCRLNCDINLPSESCSGIRIFTIIDTIKAEESIQCYVDEHENSMSDRSKAREFPERNFSNGPKPTISIVIEQKP